MTETPLRTFRKEETTWTLEELGEELGVHYTTVGRWEKGENRIPADKRKELADLLGVSEKQIREWQREADVESGNGSKGRRDVAELPQKYVISKDDLQEWQMAVSASGLTGPVIVLLSALPMFMDMDHWVVSVTPEAMAERAQRDLETIEAHWDEMLETEFVDRVGPAEYVLRLTFPDEE